jgi:hypothetical protein
MIMSAWKTITRVWVELSSGVVGHTERQPSWKSTMTQTSPATFVNSVFHLLRAKAQPLTQGNSHFLLQVSVRRAGKTWRGDIRPVSKAGPSLASGRALRAIRSLRGILISPSRYSTAMVVPGLSAMALPSVFPARGGLRMKTRET